MDQRRILIVGANGQLGKALQAHYPEATAVDRDSFDMSDAVMVQGYDWTKFDVILNAAVFANVNAAETPEGRLSAWQANAVGPANLAIAAAKHGLTLVHISSDYVFDGTRDPHTEDEPFSPLNVYGQSKAAGDIAASTTPKHYILRITWLIGDGPNFVRTMMGLAAENTAPTVVTDQVGRLTFTPMLVEAIDHLLTTNASYGTYNVTNDGEPASWADFARAIFKEMNREDLKVTNTTTAAYSAGKPNIAQRPLRSIMDLRKIKQTGFQLRDWREDLKDYVAQELSK